MKKKKIIFVILVLAAVWFNLGFLPEIWALKYPTIIGSIRIENCLLAMILPLCLSFLLFFKFDKLHRTSKTLFLVLNIILIFISGIYSTITTHLSSGIISQTDNIKNYLKVDGNYDDPCFVIFPKEIPVNSTNQSYHYAYEDASPFDTDFCMVAKWDLPEDEYKAEKARVLSLYTDGVLKFNEQSKLTDYFIANVESCTIIFSYSDETNTVQYVFENLSGESLYVNSVYERDIRGMNLFVPF